MNKNELNEKVAVRCGWVILTDAEVEELGWLYKAPDKRLSDHLPAYATSLDAIHAAEETLTVDQCEAFRIALITGADDRNIKNPADLYMWHASTKQRCLAFLAATETPTPTPAQP